MGWRSAYSTLIKRKIKILLIYKAIQSGAVAKSYLTDGLLIYEEILIFFFISVHKTGIYLLPSLSVLCSEGWINWDICIEQFGEDWFVQFVIPFGEGCIYCCTLAPPVFCIRK
jgi:hypothetical protein